MTVGYCFPYRRIPLYKSDGPSYSTGYVPPSRDGGTVPSTYNSASHTVDCVAASESQVRRHFGIEILSVRRDAVDLTLGRIPLLDSHDHDKILGRVVDCWIENRKLYATLYFDQKTHAGRGAEAMVARGELGAVSAGTKVKSWSAEDADGEIKITNPDFTNWGGDSSERVFTAQRWALVEISLTTVPVDTAAVIL
jgi:hypothetical protein